MREAQDKKGVSLAGFYVKMPECPVLCTGMNGILPNAFQMEKKPPQMVKGYKGYSKPVTVYQIL